MPGTAGSLGKALRTITVGPAVSGGGTLSYTPAPNAWGNSTFKVAVQDDGGMNLGGLDTSLMQTFTVTVNPVNDAPVARNDSYTTAEDTMFTAAAPGAVGNDTDVDGDSLTAVLVTGPTHGTLTLSTNGSFTYMPAANYHGGDSFTYQANDGHVDSNTSTVTLTVQATKWRYDFNADQSPTQSGYVGVLPADVYTPARGFGWLTAPAGG